MTITDDMILAAKQISYVNDIGGKVPPDEILRRIISAVYPLICVQAYKDLTSKFNHYTCWGEKYENYALCYDSCADCKCRQKHIVTNVIEAQLKEKGESDDNKG